MSQYNRYKSCPHAFELERETLTADGEKVWQRPAAWLVQGSAVHETVEEWERSNRTMTLDQAITFYRQRYSEITSRFTEETPNFRYWFMSGPYDGEADLERRFHKGEEQVRKIVEYYLAHPEEKVWVDDSGEKVIEKEYTVDLDGVKVKGYIDAAREIEELGVIPEDYKTGKNVPDPDSIQLPTYKIFLEETNDVRVRYGRYFMAEKGKPTEPYDLKDWSKDRLTEEFHWLDEKIKAREFPAKPDPKKCNVCSVNHACRFIV